MRSSPQPHLHRSSTSTGYRARPQDAKQLAFLRKTGCKLILSLLLAAAIAGVSQNLPLAVRRAHHLLIQDTDAFHDPAGLYILFLGPEEDGIYTEQPIR